MKSILLFVIGILFSSSLFGQIPTLDLAREYLLTNGSLVNTITPGVNDLTPTGSARVTVPDLTGNSDQAFQMNGDSFDGGDRGGQTDFTLSFWFKSSNISATAETIIQQYTYSNFGWYGWYVELVNGKIRATSKIYNGSVILPIVLESTEVVADGCWHHVAFTAYQHQQPGYIAQGYTRYLFVDNLLQNSGQNFFSGSLTPNFNHPGESVVVSPSGNYTAEIDNIRIYNRILWGAEVEQLFKEYVVSLPVIYVDKDATGCNNGTSWADAYTSLYPATKFAEAGQEIWVADGVYHPDIIDRAASFEIASGVSVYGGFNGTETLRSQRDWHVNQSILSGDLQDNDAGAWGFSNTLRHDNSYHVVKLNGVNPILDGLTISDGHANGGSQWDIYGSGIYLNYMASSPIIRNCIIENNTADVAAGMFTRFGNGTFSVDIENTIFRKNLSRIGSGYAGVTNGVTTLDVNVSNCLFTENVSQDKTAGDGLTASAFAQQTNSAGANITTTFSNCTFVKNQDIGTNALMNSTTRSVIGLSQAAGTGYTAELNNCIFWGNTEVGGLTTKAISNHLTAYSLPTSLAINNAFDEDNFSNIAPGNLINTSNTDPLFTDFVNNDFTLSCISPAIDAGDATGLTLPSTDLLGNSRIFNIIDLGPYERISYASITASAQDITVNLDASGNVAIAPNDVDDNSGSTCGTAFSIALSQTAFNCANLGANTVTLTATETVGGASDNTTAVVTVVDNTPPTVITQNISLNLDASGNASITATDIENGSTDNCTANGNLIMSLDVSSFDCNSLGVNTVILTVTDASGNSASSQALVTIADNIAPVAVAQDITATILSGASSVVIDASMIDNGSSDNCSFTMTLSQTEFTCAETGDNTVTLTVTDAQGNVTAINATVTVVSSIANQTVTATDNTLCSAQSTTILTGSSETNIEYTLKDDQGNVIDGPTTGTGSALTFNTGVVNSTTTFNVVAQEVAVPGDSYALDFDGINDKVVTSHSHPSGNHFTIEAWIRPTTTAYKRVLSNYGGSGGALAGDVIIDTYDAAATGTTLRLVLGGVGNVQSLHSQSNVLTPNAWNHIAVVFDNGSVLMYVDGIHIHTSTAPFVWMPSNVDPFHIGEDNPTGPSGDYFQGQMDEIRFWSTSRTQAEISANKDNCLTGTELGLDAYYDFEEQGILSAINDITGNSNGYMYSMDPNTDYVQRTNGFICGTQCEVNMSQGATVTIGDIIAPVPDIATLANATGSCQVTSLVAPTATDNCEGSITGTHNATLPITANTTITWTFDDGNGNTSTQDQDVVMNDIVAPIADIASLSSVTSECSVTSLVAPTATDDCQGTISGTHNATLPISGQGTTSVTWTYDDGNGNTSTQSQSVIIADVTAPVPAIAVLSTITEQCEVTSLTSPLANDNCEGSIAGSHNVTLPISSNTTITWTYDDGNGNTSTQTQNVVINDITAPVADLGSLPALNEECEVTSLIAPTSTDNCSGTITGTHNESLPISNNTTITWTFDDGNGNTSTQTQSVVLVDVTAPIEDLVSLPTLTAQCEITSLTAPTATDNCVGTVTATHNASLPISSSTSINWTYDDGSGNTTTQLQIVSINDLTSPTPDIATLAAINSQCSVTTLSTPTATDNCIGAISGTHNASLPITANTTVLWTYIDGNGNTSTQTQIVIIDDNTAPVLDNASLSNLTDECSITSLIAPTATDNCAGVITGTHNVTLPITSNTTVTWTFNDGSGNTNTQDQLVIINDVTPPSADIATLSDVTAQCEVTSLVAPTATDNCQGSITGTHNTVLPITASTVVSWTYDDGQGNTSTQTQSVIVDDNTSPVADIISLNDVTEVCSVNSLITPTATDNCVGQVTGTHNASYLLPLTQLSLGHTMMETGICLHKCRTL